jgi:oligopeptide transport system substrate-binding protein
MDNMISRRKFLEIAAASAAAAALASCTPSVVTQVVTSVVEQTKVVTEKETQIIEKEITSTPAPALRVLNLNQPLNAPDVGVNVDPGQSTQYASYFINFMMFSGLILLDKDLKPIPDMAESWTISTDTKVYTFKLRKDIKFDDGTPITAKDFVWTIIRNITPGLPSAQAWQLADIAGANEFYAGTSTDASTVGVKALDDYTLEVTLAHQSAYFINVCSLPAFMPLPKAAIEAAGNEKWTRPETVKCSGPFKLVEWIPGSRMEFVVNPNYHNAKPGVDRVILNQITAEATAIAAYESGDLDIVDVPAGEFPRVSADPVLSKEMIVTPELGIFHLVFTFQKPLNDVKVRHAIAMSIDKETLCTTIIPGIGAPAYEFLPPGLVGYDPTTGSELKYNPEGAKKLMVDAGYPDGKGFPDVYFSYGANPTYQTIFEALQAMIKASINVTIILAPGDQTSAGVKVSDKPRLWRQFWGADYPDSHNFMSILYTCAPPSDTGRYGKTDLFYCSKKFDDLVWAAAAEVDRDKRAALYKQCEQEFIVDNPAVIPLYYTARTRLVKPYVKGLLINGSGAPSIRAVSIEGKA